MSLILEALRKSEAERRRGTAPDVAMELPPTPVRTARATPAWLLPALVVGVFAILVAAWWSLRDPVREEPVLAQTQEPTPSTAAPVVVVREPARPTLPAPAIVAPSPPAVPPSATVAAPLPAAAARVSPAPALPAPPASQDIASIDDTALPPVKLSMHMWDESPARRFVILDGQRMGEGDRNGELVVVAIERDGVVVERNGQRARISLP